MPSVITEDMVAKLILLIVVLIVMLICALVACFYYHGRCKRLELENYRLRRTLKGQNDLKFASNAAYQEMLNAAFGGRRID